MILGQDPYPATGVSDGLGFSSTATTNADIPDSLQQIFQALVNDSKIGFKKPNHGSLKKWLQQGVLLIDVALTVNAYKPGVNFINIFARFLCTKFWRKSQNVTRKAAKT